MRTEEDKIGTKNIDDDKYYGINTSRAMENFTVSNRTVYSELIEAIVVVKKSAAITYKKLNLINAEKSNAIIEACNEILEGKYTDQFVVDALQGGAGTSTNMNVNEVIANIALEKLSKSKGDYNYINPLDDVNMGQSTNDIYPTALRISLVQLVRKLSDECSKLQEELQIKEHKFQNIIKTGRTELMDAVPITLGQEFGAYAQAISRDRWRIYKVEERLRQVNIGGTAVGNRVNAEKKYIFNVIEVLRELTGIGLAISEYPMDLTQNCDVFVEVSGLLKALAVNLMKISNDLRLMNSNTYGEIKLEELQAGSTIMPGKVNPVIPEMVTQVAIKVIANDNAISFCAGMGQFELNAFMPLIADCLIESLKLLINSVKTFREKCIVTLQADEAGCKKHLLNATAILTAISKYIGYNEAYKISKECDNDIEKIREQIITKNLMSTEEIDKILNGK